MPAVAPHSFVVLHGCLRKQDWDLGLKVSQLLEVRPTRAETVPRLADLAELRRFLLCTGSPIASALVRVEEEARLVHALREAPGRGCCEFVCTRSGSLNCRRICAWLVCLGCVELSLVYCHAPLVHLGVELLQECAVQRRSSGRVLRVERMQ